MKTEWEKVTLGDVATIQTGVAKNDGYSGETVEIPYLRVANVQDGFLDLSEIKKIKIPVEKKNRFLLQKGDVIMTEGGDFDKLGRGTIWDGQISPCAHQNHLFVVRTDCTKLNPFFLSYLSASSYGRLYFRLSSKQSTNLASINSTQLSHFPILLPPLEEQNNIVNTISIWDSAIEKTEKLISKKEKMFNFILKKIFTKKGTTCYLKKIVNINKGKQLNKECMISDGTVPVLNGGISYSGFTNFANTKRNTIAISEGGNSCGYVNFVSEDFWAGGHCYTLELKDKEVKTKFLYWMLKSKEKDIMKLRVGSGLPNIQQNDLSNLIIEIYNKNDQVKIIDVLDCQQLEISLLKKQLEQYKLQKQGLMQKLLTGEWRVR